MEIIGCALIAYVVWDITAKHYKDQIKRLTAENEALKLQQPAALRREEEK